jgi:hypothetical protein
MLAMMLLFVADPGLQTITVEGRPAETRIDLKFAGKPTFQAFLSHRPNLLVVDVVGAKMPAGVEKRIEIFGDTALAFQEHVGTRTQLLRIALNLPPSGKARATAYGDGIRLVLPRGSAVARVYRSGATAPPPGTPAAQQRLRDALKKLTNADAERRTMTAVLSDREQELERMSARLRAANDQVARLRQKLAGRNDGKRKKTKAVEGVRRKATVLRASILATKQAQVNEEKTLVQLAGDEATLRQEAARLTKELSARQSEVERLLRSEEETRSRLKGLKQRKTKVGAALSRLRVQAMAAEAQRTTLQRASREADAALLAVNDSLGSSEQRVARAERERRRIQEGIDAAKAKTRKAQKRLAKLAQRESRLGRALVKSRRKQRIDHKALSQLKGLEAKRKRVVEQLASSLTASEARSLSDKNKLKQSQESLRKVVKEVGALRARIGAIGADAAKFRSLDLVTKKRFKAQRRAHAKMNKGLSEATKALARQRAAHQQSSKRLSNLTAQIEKLELALAKQTKSAAATDASTAMLSRLEAGKRGELDRLKKASLLAEGRRRAAQRRNDALRTQIAAMDGKVTAERTAAKPVRVLLAKLESPAPKKLAPKTAQHGARSTQPPTRREVKPSLGFGGQRNGGKSRFSRVGYRPVGPERLVLRYTGRGAPRLRRVHKTKTTVFLPRVKGLKAALRRLDTSVFGGKIHAVQPQRWKNGVRVTVFHEAGLRLGMVPIDAGLELRVP